MSWKVYNPRTREPESSEGWLERLTIWWFECAWPGIKRFFRGRNNDPPGPRIAS